MPQPPALTCRAKRNARARAAATTTSPGLLSETPVSDRLPNAIKLVKACPEVRFVLDHIGKPGIKAGLTEPWRQDIETLASERNVHCKISGVATEADHKHWTREQIRPYIDHCIETFGFDRTMFGGDWHVSELAVSYPDWVEIVEQAVAGASAADKRKLFRDNATAFYRLHR